MRLLMVISAIIAVACWDVSLGDSFFNPWFELKVSLKVKKGESVAKALSLLIENAKQKYPLDYEIFLSKYKLDTTRSAGNNLDAGKIFEDQPLGVIITDLTLSSNSRLNIGEETIKVFNHHDAMDMSDRFYLVPALLKLSGKTDDGVKNYFIRNGLIISKDSDFEIDRRLKMLLVRGNESMHAKVREILERDGGRVQGTGASTGSEKSR
jgi:hypothetical protein